jgi:hypothetical protein
MASTGSPVDSMKRCACFHSRSGGKRSKAASTGVCVVNTLPARVMRSASAKETSFLSA